MLGQCIQVVRSVSVVDLVFLQEPSHFGLMVVQVGIVEDCAVEIASS